MPIVKLPDLLCRIVELQRNEPAIGRGNDRRAMPSTAGRCSTAPVSRAPHACAVGDAVADHLFARGDKQNRR